MNLKNLSDDALHESNKKSAAAERDATVRLLHHLRETERRRLFSKYRRSSLHEYVISELKYSEPEANLRISAMRMMRDVPEIEAKIANGSLSPTNLVLA